ncbi:hypothetical protein JJD41_02425 [Oxynema sp. CENA135]|uniref:hypothetical protein n=1 Tax=Oxynema sp. CENA135 TaxID=984206 RepID=UPI00190B2573|nr:hypothetical protein [Oxynema sp. CENA135]MBK4728746.1 hypothetical protein [Oxynema sp. CENA135]
MYDTLLDRLGDLNPQLLRELKGRLQRRHLIAVGALSGFVQLVLSSSLDWLDLFQTLCWIEALSLFILGSYLLNKDMAVEEERGTLTFLRMSPQSSRCFYWGKLLGVPILLYWAIALAIPLQAVSVLVAGIPLTWWLSIDLLLALGCGFFYTLALLMPLNAKNPTNAIGTVALSAFLGVFYAVLIMTAFDWLELRYFGGSLEWFGLPVGNNPYLALLATSLHLGLLNRGVGWVFDRRFRNSARQFHWTQRRACWVQAAFQIWLLGLGWSDLKASTLSPSEFADTLMGLGFITCCAILFFSNVSIGHPANSVKARLESPWWRSPWWRSPWWRSVWIQLGIAGIVWLPWLVLYPLAPPLKLQALARIFVYVNVLLTVLVCYWLSVFLSKAPLRGLGAIAIVALLLSIPTLFFSSVFQLSLWNMATWDLPTFNGAIAVFVGQLLQFSLTLVACCQLPKFVQFNAIAPSSLNRKQGD